MESNAELSGAALQEAIRTVYLLTGVSMELDKATLLSGRLQRRVRALGKRSVTQYLDDLSEGRLPAAELDNLIDVVTTHKTGFFRTASIWNFLKDEFIPRQKKAGHIDAWSAACSTGQEAYSLGMLFASQVGPGGKVPWSVLATDVSPRCVATAQAGAYPVAQVDEALRQSQLIEPLALFAPSKEGLRKATSFLRQRMRFEIHNLFRQRPEKFDLVLVRNVLIYFNEADKDTVVRLACNCLRPEGILIIGESETLRHSDLQLNNLGPCIYQKPKSRA
jgi:chemotaxis protein methyltransferase CheR